MTKQDRSDCTVAKERLGLSFTIDYILFNKGVSQESTGSADKTEELGIQPKRSEATPSERTKVKDADGEEDPREEWEEVVSTTTTSASLSSDKSDEKPNQSYIALISKAILESKQKKLLLCDIYQWIMDHYPYFKSKDKNWRNSVRHNLSLNDCFIKAGRSENGKGHFWAIHPSNFKDFSKGDYHCRRARRRIRRAAGQVPLPRISSQYHNAVIRHSTANCWCCPQVQMVPMSSFAPRLYWPWPSMQQQVRHHPDLQTTVL
ncbi:forkhead box Q2 [Synchiropus splendidus]|uniref:forkhead box Q2 n=1 Tax=Synchiropus splendidus TaxID=270530 RepID=UPI00237DA486|nr:forkhead box Q2 [Synchiropus splendidus]